MTPTAVWWKRKPNAYRSLAHGGRSVPASCPSRWSKDARTASNSRASTSVRPRSSTGTSPARLAVRRSTSAPSASGPTIRSSGPTCRPGWAPAGRCTTPTACSSNCSTTRRASAVFAGPVQLLVSADAKESFKAGRNYSKTDVLGMDFSAFTRPGRYRVCVEGIGCSYPFEIADDVWTRAFQLSMKGLLHHRSGIELGPPFTDYRRPRTMHPADGVQVFASAGAEIEGGGQDGIFKMLAEKRTDRLLPEAWGGHMDAGDWDRNSRHPAAMWLLVDLYELFPRQIGEREAGPAARRSEQRHSRRARRGALEPRPVPASADARRRRGRRDRVDRAPAARRGQLAGIAAAECLRPGPGEFVHLRRDRRQTGASPGRQRRHAVEDLCDVGPPGLGLGRQAQRRVPPDADRRKTPRESRPRSSATAATWRRSSCGGCLASRRSTTTSGPRPSWAGAGTRWSSTRRSSRTPACRTEPATPRCATRPASGSSRWPTAPWPSPTGNAFGVTTSIPQLPPMGFVGYLSTPEMIGAILPHAWLLTHDDEVPGGCRAGLPVLDRREPGQPGVDDRPGTQPRAISLCTSTAG